jgi:hypothetical protein
MSRSPFPPCGADASSVAAGRVFLHLPVGEARAAAEALIRRVYQDTYAARISEFLPLLLELRGKGDAAAVLGMRPARAGEPLYLEHYLERPIEQEIAARTGRPVLRGDIVEIGNLAASAPGLSAPLFLVMAAALAAAGYRWLAFTATPHVEKMVAKMNYAPLSLCDVDVGRLGERARQWGSYYATRPRVMCCDLVAALQSGGELPRIAALLALHAPAIECIARQLRTGGTAP